MTYTVGCCGTHRGFTGGRSLGAPYMEGSSLGIAPAVAVPLATSAIKLVAPPIKSFFQTSDPDKNAQRDALSDSLYQRALAGDTIAEAHLRCKAGQITPLAISAGLLDSQGGCELAGGSDPSRQYAQQLVAQLEADRRGGTLAPYSPGGLLAGAGVPPDLAGVANSPLLWAALIGGALWFATQPSGR